LPVHMMRMCVVNRWCAGSGTFKQQTRILAPDGVTEALKGREVEIKLGSDEQTATSVEVFVNPKFQHAGMYWVEILLDDNIKMRYPFAIRVKPQQPPTM